MGRTNPKLVPFLRENLERGSFKNLRYEDENIFYIELPRYDKDRCEEYESILKAWYEKNGKLTKYLGYSNGKSVFQAALKKSVYLISLPSIGKRLRFSFATQEQIIENKRLLKEKAKCNLQPLSPSSDPPSVASSGYSSGNDCEAENMQTVDMCMNSPLGQLLGGSPRAEPCNQGLNVPMDMYMPDDFLEDVLKCPEYYIGGSDGLEDLFSDVAMHDFKVESPPLENPYNIVPQQVMKSEDFEPLNRLPEFMKTVTELKPTPVGNFSSEKKYWLCTQKVKVKGTLQLICEMQIIEDGNTGIKEGSVVIPNDVFEPGVSYQLNKSFELNDLRYYFFTPNSV